MQRSNRQPVCQGIGTNTSDPARSATRIDLVVKRSISLDMGGNINVVDGDESAVFQ